MSDTDQPPSKTTLLKWSKALSRLLGQSKERKQQAPSRGGAVPPYSPSGRGLEPGQDGRGRVFGVRLEESLQYASVAISMVAPDGNQYVYGYVPIVVAKCGMMLKETATQTEGIFRVSGSNRRINQLQTVFDAPPRYGKDFDWTGYSVHDAASVLRRYLNSLPEPVIPAGLYLDFTAVLQKPQPIAASIAAYRHLISLLPPASRYLLLYLLDFLSVFARCSDKNLMTASNLAVVFQPGLVSSRSGGQNALLGFPGFVEGKLPPGGSAGAVAAAAAAARGGGAQEQAGEHGRGKEVLEFLIEQQAHFMLGLEPPVDEERQKRKGVEAVGAPQAVQSIAAQEISERQAEEKAAAGSKDLHRRGSEKSVERRRLRKSADTKEGGKVKRSKTWGSSTRRKRAEGRDGSPSPNVTPASHSPQPPAAAAFASASSHGPPHGPTLAPPVATAADASPRLSHQPSVKKARKSAGSTQTFPLPVPPSLSPELAGAPAPFAPPSHLAAPNQDASGRRSSASGGSHGRQRHNAEHR
ncbi:rho GTPase-activating protein [Rhodotorula toruloides]|uniref:Rho GTPase-activating protein n=1 Tax=Rhodotorula toruloides TaxID=5286 RepID=A0A511KGN8_RHOTO|nr:rho GTPase-activating protein [Rhodotorula toruloides]